MHFGCVELVEQHGMTRSSRPARHVERVVSCPDVTWRAKWNLGLRLIDTKGSADISCFIFTHIAAMRLRHSDGHHKLSHWQNISTKWYFVMLCYHFNLTKKKLSKSKIAFNTVFWNLCDILKPIVSRGCEQQKCLWGMVGYAIIVL